MRTAGLDRLLQELVALASPSGDETAAADFMASTLAAGGVDVQRVGNSLVAALELGPGPRVLFNTHLDTVPIGTGWTQVPLGADWVDGRLYGRGSNDAKASVAAMAWALLDAAAGGRGAVGASGTWMLALTACEETTNQGMTAVLETIDLPDGAVTGEPTGLEVVRAQVGLAVLRATWSGRSCHAAHVARVEHDNAMLRAAAEIGATGPYLTFDDVHPLLGASTVAPTVLHAGERHNVVPDHAEALFDARLAPPHTAADVVAMLQRRLPTAAVEVRSERLSAVETAADHPFVQSALALLGREAALGSSGLSDMALLGGIPAIKCGPGETSRSHTPDEFVLLEELEAGAAFYRAFGPRALQALAAAQAVR